MVDAVVIPHPAGFFHHPAAGGVFRRVAAGHPLPAHLPEPEIPHRAQGLGGIALAPEGAAIAVARLPHTGGMVQPRGMPEARVLLLALHHADAAEGRVRPAQADAPLVVVRVLVKGFPAGQQLGGLQPVFVGLPAQKAGHLRSLAQFSNMAMASAAVSGRRISRSVVRICVPRWRMGNPLLTPRCRGKRFYYRCKRAVCQFF